MNKLRQHHYRRKFFRQKLISSASVIAILLLLSTALTAQNTSSPDLGPTLDNLEIPQLQLPLCFGLRDIVEPRALAVCDALSLKENVKARELAENWIRSEANSPAAQFALAEVLLTVEGNMPRALFHLNQAEELTDFESLFEALDSDNYQWHYLTLSQLSYVHQLMGNQLESLAYLDKINQVYGQDIESFRGWSLIKLKKYDEARASANLVLQNSEDDRERARAWNTLCAADLASLQPIESMSACDRAIEEDEASDQNDYDTVYLTNASEVALSLLQIDKAEEYLDRATRFINPDSVADPWVYKLYLTMSQGRFDEARAALDRMLIWRESQEPLVAVMNRAEHFLVSASFLLLAGYAEDAAKLTTTALNQPDRNGSYSADDFQKDAYAALINMMAFRAQYQITLEQIASMDLVESFSTRIAANKLKLNAWRAERRAASLFANNELLQNRLRPYAPLDVHIPEWVEPELVGLMGHGVISSVLDEARLNGAFMLNEGYYFSYKTEISFLSKNYEDVIAFGERAQSLLPQQEVLLKARANARIAEAAWQLNQPAVAMEQYELAIRLDPSIIRRLETSLPVRFATDESNFANRVQRHLSRSPRFSLEANGFVINITSNPELSACLQTSAGDSLSCFNMSLDDSQSSNWNAKQLSDAFHRETFGLGYEISKAQRSVLLGSSVILSSQTNPNLQRDRDAILNR